MNDHLITYLTDHLAGSKFALELLEELSNQAIDSELTKVASELLPMIQGDRVVLETLLASNPKAGQWMKDALGWIAQKLSQAKLSTNDKFGCFEAAEMLCLGILGKKALWETLQAANQTNLPLSTLINNAVAQHDLLNAVRKRLAQELFAGAIDSSGDSAGPPRTRPSL